MGLGEARGAPRAQVGLFLLVETLRWPSGGPEPKPWELAAGVVVVAALRVRGGSASAAVWRGAVQRVEAPCGLMLAPSGGGFADWSP